MPKKTLVIVPGRNNVPITEEIERSSILEKVAFQHNKKQISGYWIPEEHESTIINHLLDNFSDYESTKIYKKDKDGQYHLQNINQLKVLVGRTNNVVDPKLKKSLRNMKERMKNKHSPAIILHYTYINQSVKTSMEMIYNTAPFFAKEIDEVIEWAILPLIRFHPGIISDWAIFTRNNEGNIFPVNSKVINKIMHKLIDKVEIKRLNNLKMRSKKIKEIVKINNS